MIHPLLVTITTRQSARQFKLRSWLLWVLLGCWMITIGLVYSYQQQLQQAQQALTLSQHEFDQSLNSIRELREAEQQLFTQLDSQYDRWRHFDNRLQGVEVLAGLSEVDITPIPTPYQGRLAQVQHKIQLRQQMLTKIPNGNPMEYRRVSSQFGSRKHPISFKRHRHTGVDLRADKGQPIYATADGYVQQARDNYDRGYGNMVTLSHQMGFDTRYAHMNSVAVKYGQFVRKGELVGYCGNSGDSTASHLHYEVRFLGNAIDPKPFMSWNLANYEQIFETVGTLPWDSFQAELTQQLQPLEPQLSQQVPSSMVPLSSVATFTSTGK
ncbi:M23 family metallopeptidase [Neiella marina]|uniref:M23 family metallopeptidase n=1 Tax=Neiella holothuriorum TaxID=2870530 RepID=A0ABS7EDV9_9GAMM|nr:M23 family metallopeptidase [Neiella holothuriorum]MBW8190536.1 M23 family metallopeptidase [Neiella holothuriorum]